MPASTLLYAECGDTGKVYGAKTAGSSPPPSRLDPAVILIVLPSSACADSTMVQNRRPSRNAANPPFVLQMMVVRTMIIGKNLS